MPRIIHVQAWIKGKKYLLDIPDEPLAAGVHRDILDGSTYPIVKGSIPDNQHYRWPGLKEIRMILDVGANVGSASVWLGAQYPEAHVIAVEPNHAIFDILKKNLGWNLAKRCQCAGVALGKERKKIPIHVFENSVLSTFHKARFLDNEPGHWQEVEVYPGTELLYSLGVKKIDLLKVDTEGSEREVLAGLGHHAREARIAYVEFHSEDDRRWIDDFFWDSHVLYHIHQENFSRGVCIYVKRLCVPNKYEANRQRIA